MKDDLNLLLEVKKQKLTVKNPSLLKRTRQDFLNIERNYPTVQPYVFLMPGFTKEKENFQFNPRIKTDSLNFHQSDVDFLA